MASIVKLHRQRPNVKVIKGIINMLKICDTITLILTQKLFLL